MPLNKTFNRPKLATTLSKPVVISAAVAEGTDEFILDVILTVTKDDTSTATKTAVRVVLPVKINGTTLIVEDAFYTFPGNATSYASGGATPSLSAGVKGNSVELNNFLSLAGDLQENS